jgi:hypothetical protein
MAIGPAATASTELAEACESFVTSVVLGADIVPRLSYYTVEALLDELAKKSPALNIAANIRKSFAQTLAPLTRGVESPSASAERSSRTGGPQEVEMKNMDMQQPPRAAAESGFDALADAAKRNGNGANSNTLHAMQHASSVLAGQQSMTYARQNGLPLPGLEPLAESVPNHDAALDSDTDAGKMADLSDGMALGVGQNGASAAVVGQGTRDAASLWKWLDPMKSVAPMRALLFGAGASTAEGGPFSTDALAARTQAAKARSKAEAAADAAAAAAAEAGTPKLRDLSVGDPVRYLREAGLSPGVAAGAPPSPELDGAPSSILRMDQGILAEADAGHQAAHAGTAPPPPPVYPAGRILWLLPTEQPQDGGQPCVMSSTYLPSTRARFAAHDIFPRTPPQLAGRRPPESWDMSEPPILQVDSMAEEEFAAATAAADAAGRAEAEAYAGTPSVHVGTLASMTLYTIHYILLYTSTILHTIIIITYSIACIL